MPGADKRDIVNNEDIICCPQLKIGLFFEKFDVFSFCYGSVLLHILFFRDRREIWLPILIEFNQIS